MTKKTDTEAKTEETLLRVVKHPEWPEIIFLEIDTTVSADTEKWTMVPFLNIYGFRVFEGESLDQALATAKETEDAAYIYEVLDTIEMDQFEISLSAFYPQWPEETEGGDKELADFIISVHLRNKEDFKHVKKMFLTHVGSLKFFKIIDRPA